MNRRRQHGRLASSHAASHYPGWIRVLAMFCVMLSAGMGTVQAVHIHGDWLPKNGAHASIPAAASTQAQGEEHCPLCVAMHSTLPAGLQVLSAPVLEIVLRVAGNVLVSQQRLETFAVLSRPPPAPAIQPVAAA